MKKKKVLLEMVLGVVLVIIMLFTLENEGKQISLVIAISFLVNGIVITYLLTKSISRYVFSLECIHNFFIMIFFWLSPLIQMAEGFVPWGLRYEDKYILIANALIIVWCLVFNIGVWLSQKKTLKNLNSVVEIQKVSSSFINILFCISFVIMVLYIARHGFSFGNFGEDNAVFEIETRSVAVLVDHCLTGFVTFATMFSIVWYKNKKVKINTIVILLQGICLLMVAFPLSISRYAAGSIYSCLLIHMFPSLRRGHKFIFLFTIGFTVLFPILGLFRYSSISEIMMGDVVSNFTGIRNYYASGNFDAYQMIIATLKTIEREGYTFGRQMLGTLLFFVPRSVWSDKPLSTGTYIAEKLGLSFGNISCPLNMEIFMDFGIVGYVGVACLLGYFISLMDNSYWKQEKEKRITVFSIGYPFMVPYFLFLSRGSLMSTYSNLCAYMVMLICICKAARLKIRITWRSK